MLLFVYKPQTTQKFSVNRNCCHGDKRLMTCLGCLLTPSGWSYPANHMSFLVFFCLFLLFFPCLFCPFLFSVFFVFFSVFLSFPVFPVFLAAGLPVRSLRGALSGGPVCSDGHGPAGA